MREQPQEENLAYRAAELYAKETGWPRGFEIVIKKRIPIGGGLGGGSADAAAVLRILNSITEKPVSNDALRSMAFQLGSDVPFLTSDYSLALGWNRGEKLLGLPPLPSRDVYLFFPPFGVDTGEAYALLDESRHRISSGSPELTAEMFEDWESAARHSVNDFEPVIRKKYPVIDLLLSRADKYELFYRLSGSGSTVFKIPGVTRTGIEPVADLPALSLPQGTKRVVTRTSDSVVPVEILD
jgi:4-diphosphocytidyl-2-C-methyl-D-erythritol kinase